MAQQRAVEPDLAVVQAEVVFADLEVFFYRPSAPGDGDLKQPLVARFGGIPLVRQKDATLVDRVPNRPVTYPVKELTVRLRRGRCELCEQPGKVQVHQIRKLAQLEPAGAHQPPWKVVMARKRRKTLVVCHPCHDTIHTRQPTAAAA